MRRAMVCCYCVAAHELVVAQRVARLRLLPHLPLRKECRSFVLCRQGFRFLCTPWACCCNRIRHINPYSETTLTPNTSTQLAHQSTSKAAHLPLGNESLWFVLCRYALGLLLNHR
jgi:hypothetical protein